MNIKKDALSAFYRSVNIRIMPNLPGAVLTELRLLNKKDAVL